MSDNNYENRGTVKVVRQQLHEINDLRIKYKDVASKYKGLAEDFSDLRIMNSQLRGENKKYKVLLQVATKEIASMKKDIVEDLRQIDFSNLTNSISNLIEKWEGK